MLSQFQIPLLALAHLEARGAMDTPLRKWPFPYTYINRNDTWVVKNSVSSSCNGNDISRLYTISSASVAKSY